MRQDVWKSLTKILKSVYVDNYSRKIPPCCSVLLRLVTCIILWGLVSKVALAGGNFSVLLVSSNTLDCYSNEDFITNNNYVSSRSVVIMASDETSDGNPVIVKKMKDTNACMPNDMGSQSQNAVIQPLLTGMKNSHIFPKDFSKTIFQ